MDVEAIFCVERLDSKPSGQPSGPIEIEDPLQKLLHANFGYPKETSDARKLKPLQAKSVSFPGLVKTHVGGLFWLTFENEAAKDSFIKQGHVDVLTVVPKSNPMMKCVSKPMLLTYNHATRKEVLGVPRFWGLSQFGFPQSDSRDSRLQMGPSFQGTLRPMQEICVRQCKADLDLWGGSTLLCDCGFGKTATSIAIACMLNQKTLILCNRDILMTQWISAIQEFVPECGLIGFLQGSTFLKGPAGTCRPKDPEYASCYFYVASIESIAECDWPSSILRNFGLVIVDEMHHIAAQSLVHVLPLLPSRYVIGLTATPNRADGLEHVLYWLTGPTSFVYQRLPSITGIHGSVHVKLYEFSGGRQKEIVYKDGTLGFAQMMTILSKDYDRNEVLKEIILQALSERQKVIVVTSHVDHAKGLFDLKLSESQAILAGPHQMPKEAKDPKCRLVFATYSLLSEGYDDPYLDALVLAMPRSNVQQTIGRIERTMPGKKVPIVYDLIDMFSLLPAMASKRNRFYQSRGFSSEVVRM